MYASMCVHSRVWVCIVYVHVCNTCAHMYTYTRVHVSVCVHTSSEKAGIGVKQRCVFSQQGQNLAISTSFSFLFLLFAVKQASCV